jgi:hypothetical protein
MFRHAILIIFINILFCAGFAQAQNIFNKYKGDQKVGTKKEEEPTLFVKPDGFKSEQKVDTSKFMVPKEVKLKNKQLQAEAAAKIAIYQDWIKSGKKPKTPEEIRAYADASRAYSQALTYQRREALTVHLEKAAIKREKLRLEMLAAQQKAAQQAAAVVKAASLKKLAAKKASQKDPQKAAQEKAPAKAVSVKKTKPVYKKPELTTKPKPLFNTF